MLQQLQSVIASSKRRITLDAALSEIPMGLFQWRLLFMCGMAFISDAVEVNLLTFLATCAGDQWGLSSAQEATISGIVFAGMVFGTILWGKFADHYGRRMAFLCGCATISFGGILSGLSPSYQWLIVFRTIAGVGIGSGNIPTDLLAEFSPPNLRGKFLIYLQCFWTLGSLFITGLAWASLAAWGWKALAFMAAIPVTLNCFGSYFYLPESPRWLLIKGKQTEAEEVLQQCALVNGFQLEPFHLLHDDANNHETDAQYTELFADWVTLKISCPLWVLVFVYGFVYYGIILFVGRLYSTDSSNDDGTCSFDYQSIFINATGEVLGCLLSFLLIDTLGRVRTSSMAFAATALTVFLMGIEMNVAGLLTVGILARMSAILAQNAVWVSVPEHYRTELRTVGHASCVAAAKIGAFLSPFLVTSNASPIAVASVLAIVSGIASLTAHLLPETKGMSMDMTDERINLSHEGTVGIGFDDRGKGENINADEFVDIRNPVAKDIELSLGER